MSDLKPGQKLWHVPQYGCGREVTIEKVGRFWATLSGNDGRIDIKTLYKDGKGHSYPGVCYLSREIYENEQARRAVWGRLQRALRDTWTPPPNITISDIKQVAALLGVSLEDANV